jgi:hypothetical protein
LLPAARAENQFRGAAMTARRVRTPAQFRADERRELTEALAKASYEVEREYAAELGMRQAPPWEQVHEHVKYIKRVHAARILIRGGGVEP